MPNEEYRLLKDIAQNSGRDSYITDERFEVLWSNGREPLTAVLLGLKTPLKGRDIRRETVLACKDGRALKITPVVEEGRIYYFLFELYGSSELLVMLGATSVFAGFTRAAEEARYSMLDYARELSVSANAVNISRYGKLCSASVNFMSILRILGGIGSESAQDITALLRQIACWFTAASVRSGALTFEADIDESLTAVIEKTAFECAVVNLLMNGFLHCEPPEGKLPYVKLTAFAEAGRTVIHIDDNGCKADPAYVDGFREVYIKPVDTSRGEGLGVSLAEVFCKRFGGKLSFGSSPLGGLRAVISLPMSDPHAGLTFFAPSPADRSIPYIRDIMRKGFPDVPAGDIFGN